MFLFKEYFEIVSQRIYNYLDILHIAYLYISGAKDFFEAKVNQLNSSSKFEEEIRKEQEDRKAEMEAIRLRKQAFKAKAQSFEHI